MLRVQADNLPALHSLVTAYAATWTRSHDNGDGWTLLRHAIDVEHDGHLQTGRPLHVDATAFLLARGADPQRRGPDGTTPLQDAETRGHWLAVEMIRAWTAQRPAPR